MALASWSLAVLSHSPEAARHGAGVSRRMHRHLTAGSRSGVHPTAYVPSTGILSHGPIWQQRGWEGARPDMEATGNL